MAMEDEYDPFDVGGQGYVPDALPLLSSTTPLRTFITTILILFTLPK